MEIFLQLLCNPVRIADMNIVLFYAVQHIAAEKGIQGSRLRFSAEGRTHADIENAAEGSEVGVERSLQTASRLRVRRQKPRLKTQPPYFQSSRR